MNRWTLCTHPVIAGPVLSSMLLTGCGVPALLQDPRQMANLSMPAPAHSKYFDVTGAGFLIEAKDQPVKMSYTLSLHVKQSQSMPLYFTVEYEDPAKRGHRFVQEVEVQANAQDVSLQSDPVEGLRPGWDYWVTVTAYSDSARTQEIDRFTQRIRSSINSRLFRK